MFEIYFLFIEEKTLFYWPTNTLRFDTGSGKGKQKYFLRLVVGEKFIDL